MNPLEPLAPVFGFLLGALVVSKTAAWIQTLLVARPLFPAALLHSGPWLLAAMAYFAYHVLSRPHADHWNWFFGAAAAAVPALVALGAYLYFRRSPELPAEQQAQRLVMGVAGKVTGLVMLGIGLVFFGLLAWATQVVMALERGIETFDLALLGVFAAIGAICAAWGWRLLRGSPKL